MKYHIRSTIGATLLEVMLVLSIVGLIILMSVRYYQSATTASQVQQAMGIVQAITAAATNLSSTLGYASANTANIGALLGTSVLTTPWGTSTSITGTVSNYVVTIPGASAGICAAVSTKIKTNPKIQGITACSGTSGINYTFNPAC